MSKQNLATLGPLPTLPDVTVPARKHARPLLKVLASTVGVLAFACVAAHFIWKYSGSNEWSLALDKDGVQIFALKEPGSTLKKFRAFTQIPSTMTRAIAAMRDTDIKTCSEWMSGCAAGQSIEPWSDERMSFTHFYRVNLPGPLAPREFLLKAQFTPNPRDKSVFIQFEAQPDRLPRNDCCLRVTRMNSSWRYTPVGEGKVDVEFTQDVDSGLPYFVANALSPSLIYDTLTSLPKHLNKEKYDRQQFAFVGATAMAH
jgi:hypothetical protein